MIHATFLTIFLFGAISALAYGLKEPMLFVVGLLCLPNVLQCLPWGLAASSDDEEEGADPKIGFTANV